MVLGDFSGRFARRIFEVFPEPRMNMARRSRNQSSAELYSAVSRICNPLAVTKPGGSAKSDPLPNAIRRYGRLEICATSQRERVEKICAGKQNFHGWKYGRTRINPARQSRKEAQQPQK
jgi:hypothetical protein